MSLGELSTFSDITYVKHARLWYLTPAQSFLQYLRRFQYILFSQHPCPPMYSHRFPALGVLEDLNGVKGIGMHGRENPARVVCPYGYQTQVKRPPQFADLLECWTPRVVEIGTIVVRTLWKLRYSSVPGVATEPDFLASALDAPRRPQRVASIEGRSGTGMLAWEARDMGTHAFLANCLRCTRVSVRA